MHLRILAVVANQRQYAESNMLPVIPATGDDGTGKRMSQATGVVGNIADLSEGQALLPSFVESRPDGLFVSPELALFESGFLKFVERVFAAGARFSALDYETFLALLYGVKALPDVPVRVADAIVSFPAARRVLYRAVKLSPDKSAAEYMFEPVEIEVEETAMLFGEPAEDGSAVVLGEEKRKRSEPTSLDFDEFVAAMWEKGVRFGIHADEVRAAIISHQACRVEIAHALPPTAGRDASIREKTQALHRDDTPRILPDGRMDLCQFKNRFPQIAVDAPLLQKITRELGKSGRDVAGALLEPEIPKDFDITSLAGPGTRVEKRADGEYILAARDGFINIDAQTNQISVTEKIVSHEGVSMRATGDVVLSGDEFEEHGEVQERRVVEGHHMTFFAAVYGNVISRGGRIALKAGIAGGQATSPGGSIVVEGRASRATLEARGGDIQLEFAEGCSIVGSRVTITHAVNCDILGETVRIGASEGCAIAGKMLKVERSAARKDTETIVTVLTPDMTRFDVELLRLDQDKGEAAAHIAELEAKLAGILANTEFKQYLSIVATLAKGGAALSAAHEARWRQTQATFAPLMRECQSLQKALAAARADLAATAEVCAELAEKRAHAGDELSCAIVEVAGDTLVRRMTYQPDQSVVGGAQAREIASHLREFGVSSDRLFWASSGSFAWRHDLGVCDIGQL